MAIVSGNGALFGTDAADQITGGDGSDTLTGGAGADVLNGGSGVDFAEYPNSPSGIEASIAAGVVGNDGTGSSDTLISIEGIVGSLNNDRLVGSALPDVLIGLGGADTIDGAGGDDLLRGSSGADQIAGGDGIDTAFYSGGLRSYALAVTGPASPSPTTDRPATQTARTRVSASKSSPSPTAGWCSTRTTRRHGWCGSTKRRSTARRTKPASTPGSAPCREVSPCPASPPAFSPPTSSGPVSAPSATMEPMSIACSRMSSAARATRQAGSLGLAR